MRGKGGCHRHVYGCVGLAASGAALLAIPREAACAFACKAQNMRPAVFHRESGLSSTSRRLVRNPQVQRRQQVDSVRTSSDLEQRRQLTELVSRHRATTGKALWNLSLTAGLWSIALYLIHATSWYWLSLPLMAMVISRIFMVFHDASHMSFFKRTSQNRWLAEVSQFFVNYNWRYWASIHNSHHAHFGDSTVKDTSLTIWFSEDDLRKAPWYLRAAHRFVRDPFLFYPLASLFVFFINKPLTHAPMRLALPLLLWATLGAKTALWYVVATWMAGMLGVVAFHLQHHCNPAYRVPTDQDRSSFLAAMAGSTRIPLPFPLSVFSMGIEYHHIHHHDVRVPGYNLQRCDAEGEELGLWKAAGVNTVNGWRAFKSLFHTQFEGSVKVAEPGMAPPRFKSFWPYTVLKLQDA
mmetsp:Transcript_4583/g.7916  ORF Transcript_4583/g.7916 Transcript_4583/m.7916 type:complete len:408 (-) Transcript_4583:98-1321(-)